MDQSAHTFEGRASEARVGQLLRGKWRLTALLGSGGMANVYAATHRNGRRGAVKVLHAEMAANADVRARFLREGYVANKVEHRGAVAVLDDDQTDDGTVFLVMELLDGQTVHALAETRPQERLDVREVSAIADQVLDVLVSAHDKGIVHRDLKPENLFLTRDGDVKVLDFGIARLLEGRSASIATQAGSLYGTPAFMSPEQARGLWDQVDGRSDLWALGATLFTLLTGREVHVGARTLNELMLAAMSDAAPPVGSLLQLPHALEHVIDRALAFEQKERWPDARAMQTALRSAYAEAFGEPMNDSLSRTLAGTLPASSVPAASTVSATRIRAVSRARWVWPCLCVVAVAAALVAALASPRHKTSKQPAPTPAALPTRVTPLLAPTSPRLEELEPHDAAVAVEAAKPAVLAPRMVPKRRPARAAETEPTGFVPPTLER